MDLILSRDAYLLVTELRLLWTAAAAYAVSFFLHILHILSGKKEAGKAARYALTAGASLNTLAVILRLIEAGGLPLHTRYETLLFFVLSSVVISLYISSRRNGVFPHGTLVAAVAAGSCFYSLLSLSPLLEPCAPQLNNRWFEWHAAAVFLSFGVITVSASVEASSLLVKPLLKNGMGLSCGLSAETLEDFRETSHRLVLFAFPLMAFAIFARTVWSSYAFGGSFSSSAQTPWLLLVFALYAMCLHSAHSQRASGIKASVFNILGFIAATPAIFGFNWPAALFCLPGPYNLPL